MKLLIHYFKFTACLLSAILLAGNGNVFAQTTKVKPAEDTLQEVEILSATKRLTFQTIDDSTKLTIIAGDVKLRQGTTLFYCDSCVINSNTSIFEAWGKVHINDADTTNIYSNHLRYLMKPKLAYLDGGVKLTDGKAILTTPDLEYDMETNIGIYKNGGKVVNKKTTLTSQEGWYYSDMKDVYFKKKVVLKDPAYNIVTDSLLYNSESQTTRFISMTTITDSNGRVIKTKEGYYNQQTGKAEFSQRPVIIDGETEITGNTVSINDSSSISVVQGNAIIVDKKNKTTIIAGAIYRNKKTEAIMAIRKPLMIIVQDKDSIYISADTLFSARLTDLYTSKKSVGIPLPDKDTTSVTGSITPENQKDSLKADVIAKDTLFTGQNPKAIQTMDSTSSNNSKADTLVRQMTAKDFISRNTGKGDTLLTGRTGKLNNSQDSLTKTDIIKDTLIIEKNLKDFLMKDSISGKSMKPETIVQLGPGRLNNSKDSILVHTTKGVKMVVLNEKDSTNRYFEAYRNVRIFNDSLQAVCDSMFYSFKDSVFRLYEEPVVWSKESQITGDTLLLFTKNKKADKVEAFENSLLVNKMDEQAFNQIKSTRMDGYFVNGDIDSVRAKGSAECIYYIQDEDSAYTGINQSKADIMDIYFRNKELFKVVFRSSVTGTLWPIRQKSPSEMRLPNFKWLEQRRPKTKFDMYE